GAVLWQVWPALAGSLLEEALRATMADGQSRQCLYTPAGQTQSYEVICTPQAQGVAVSLRAGRRKAQQLQQQRTDRKLHES
ncbi:hypothetical protein ACP3WZ_25870, partial [Salmonella enterica]|uniref:hypothetical protein n=1 Tax=Salmonella enterica TaxID=28901 RepID=UPI003CE8C88B